jgi:aromatic-L-amino-acid decarboxylase
VLSVVTMRHHRAGLEPEALDEHNERLLRVVLDQGDFLISHTRVHGRYAIRVAINYYYTDARDVRELWDVLRRCAASL